LLDHLLALSVLLDLPQFILVQPFGSPLISLVFEGELKKASDCQAGRVYSFSAVLEGGDDRLDNALNRPALLMLALALFLWTRLRA